MKGVVFTEFLEMVERSMGLQMMDRIILAADLPHSGAYTSVGTYDHGEMARLAGALSQETNVEVSELMRRFGTHLFRRFSITFPQFFQGATSAFSFLSKVGEYIHGEVVKLYPDAELPTITHYFADPDTLQLSYQSPRHLGDLAEGLILGCIQQFGEPIRLQRFDMTITQDTQSLLFVLSRAHQ